MVSFTSIFYSAAILRLCVVNAAPALVDVTGDIDIGRLYASSGYHPTDSQLIETLSKELEQITSYNGTNSTTCQRCISRLELGKQLALFRPDLISPVFSKWCIENKIQSKTSCEIYYGRNTVANNSQGSNFANMLYLMDPAGYDGQLYCYFKESSACSLPATPDVDLSDRWPAKQSKHYYAPTPSNETYNVLHVSDFHIELDYQVGAEANCSQGMCCTPHNYNSDQVPDGYNFTQNYTSDEIANLSYTPAWYDEDFNLVKGDPVDVFGNDSVWWPANTFGGYECDAPEVLINSSLKSIVKYQEEEDLNFDFTIFTGDLVDHDDQQYLDFNKAVDSEEIIFRDMKTTLKDIPVYSVLGNHDTYPYGQLSQEKSGFANTISWNADLMADLWEEYGWINATTASYARKHYTGFSVTSSKNLKIISLNSNAYYIKNLYAYWNATDIDSFGQFQFLIDELVESEAVDQRVWIIAHIPFVQDALPLPAKVFTEIVKRFSPYTIAGIFFGHTHLDQFSLLYNETDIAKKDEDSIVNVAWISQAVTPLTENNPSWRWYTIDKQTHQVMNSYNYYTKLNETFVNDSEEPVWEFEYSAREAYDVEWPTAAPLNATFWHRVASQVNSSEEVAQTYNNYKKRFSPYTPNCIGTDECVGSYCPLISFTLEEYTKCKKVLDEPQFYK